MARKDLLKGLMEGSKAPAPPPRYAKGAVGAVSKSIADLQNRAILELDPFAIDSGGLEDRLEHDAADHAALMASLKDHGQQVPVLVRPKPDAPDRYEVVYGRRRLLALRDLGMPVKAMVRELDDEALIIAQGQENNARKDLSFIEKANFARQMVEAGYTRKIVCEALMIDKTVISRMLQVFETVPLDLVRMIGSAHGIGRDRWAALSRLWPEAESDLETARMVIGAASKEGSDARFEAVFDWLSGRKAKSVPAGSEQIYGAGGEPLGSVRRTARAVDIQLRTKGSDGFETWLIAQLPEIHRTWKNSQSGEDVEQDQHGGTD